MEFFLDTANIREIKKYNEIYNITGVTTNPVIISREKCEFFPTLCKIREIIGNKQLHVQVSANTCDEMLKEAETIVNKIDKNVYIKVPVNEEGIKTIKVLKERGYNVTATVIYTVEQAIMASSVGADYVAPYYNHMCNISVDASLSITEMAKIFKMYNKPTKILAASFRNTNQIMQCISCGAEAVTVAPSLYTAIFENAFTGATISRFNNTWNETYEDKKIYEL